MNLKSDISVDSSSTNTGLIHSSIRQNWSQSLNIGSVSIAATLVILFVSLVMYLRTSDVLMIWSKMSKLLGKKSETSAKEMAVNPNKSLLMTLNSEFDSERNISYSCLCDSSPEDCLCQDVQITVTVHCKVTQWLQDNKFHIASSKQVSEVPELGLKNQLCTVTYAKVTRKLKEFL